MTIEAIAECIGIITKIADTISKFRSDVGIMLNNKQKGD
jgi:hypothetical protein